MRGPLLCGWLLLVSACGASSTLGPVELQSGAELFMSQKCATCHGSDGRGTFLDLGPSLEGVARFWTVEEVARYLLDPAAYAATDPRLGEREMPAFDALGLAERERLGAYVRELGQ